MGLWDWSRKACPFWLFLVTIAFIVVTIIHHEVYMFGKLSGPQKKTLRNILIEGELIDTVAQRKKLLQNAKLGDLQKKVHLQEDNEIFAGEVINECERWGKPPVLGEYATVLLALYLREELSGTAEIQPFLTQIIALYVPDHEVKYPAITSEQEEPTSSRVLRILFLASNPTEWGKLSLEEELQLIQESKGKAQESDPVIDIKIQPYAKVKDEEIISLIQSYQPHILHFAGHGNLERAPAPTHKFGLWRGLRIVKNKELLDIPDEAKPSGIVLETSDGTGRLLPSNVLQEIFADPQTAKSIRLVFLNACWAQGQAELLVEKAGVPFAVGMNNAVNDKAAVRFAQGFYQTLFNRQFPMRSAFNSGKNQMVAVLGAGHEDTPTLKVRGGLSAETYHIFDTL
jgi:hypothetical protein